MARDFDRMLDTEGLSDDELYDLIIQQFNEQPELDTGWIDVSVRNGLVTLSGRVGTDSEVRTAENILNDVLGIREFANELIVDELHREMAPEAADDAAAADREADDQRGERNMSTEDSAQHLIEDLDGQTFGTHDLQSAIQDGIPYVPPDRPMADGYGSGEDH
ncbi:MAG: BON domain-containing protein [Gemmatimonadota bacterium]|nr:BON domain-containing protein [Gemmatimonadota bacterium]